MEVKVKVTLTENGQMILGKGRAQLLEAIDTHGSISAAARETGMTYRQAWARLRTSEKNLGRPLLLRRVGGPEGGGARLTDEARELLQSYRAIQADLETHARQRERALEGSERAGK